MSLTEILDFHPDHADHIGDYLARPLLEAYVKAGPSYTLKVGDIYAAAFGMVMLSKRTAEVWMLVNEEARHRFAKTILKAARKQLDIAEISQGVHRTQITIEFSKASFVRWSELLGFKIEGLMRAYDDLGNDYFLMARVRYGQDG